VNARRTARPLVAPTFIVSLCASGAALGQQVGADIGPYDPIGLRAGQFFIFPSLTVSEVYNDNVFATDGDTTDDFITTIQPGFLVQSNFSRHALNLSVGSDVGFYASETDQNYQDFFGVADGRLDITRNSILSGSINGGRFHEARDDPEDRDPDDELSLIWRYGGQLSFLQLFNRFNVRTTGSIQTTDYTNPGDVDNTDRDNYFYGGALRVGYFISPRINVFTQGTYFLERRFETPDTDGIDRDRDTWSASAGAEVDLTNVLTGEFFFGYTQDLPKEDSFDDQGGFAYGIDLTWLPTLLTTVTLSGAGDFESTTTEGAEARFRSSVGLGVDHELLRNVLIGAAVTYIRDEFDGADRTDNTIEAGANVSYLLNRNLSINGGYAYTNRSSDDDTEEFTRNVFRVGVTGRL
jgi:hypothetical protein